jgi:hypothetical protein
MDNDYATWIAVLTVSGAFGVGVIGWVLWKSCTPAYNRVDIEEV